MKVTTKTTETVGFQKEEEKKMKQRKLSLTEGKNSVEINRKAWFLI